MSIAIIRACVHMRELSVELDPSNLPLVKFLLNIAIYVTDLRLGPSIAEELWRSRPIGLLSERLHPLSVRRASPHGCRAAFLL